MKSQALLFKPLTKQRPAADSKRQLNNSQQTYRPVQHSINRIVLPNRPERPTPTDSSFGNTIHLQKYIKDFKTEKSQTRTDRSNDSSVSTKNLHQIYDSYSNRYKQQPSMVRSYCDTGHVAKPAHKIVVAPFRNPESSGEKMTPPVHKKQSQQVSAFHPVLFSVNNPAKNYTSNNPEKDLLRKMSELLKDFNATGPDHKSFEFFMEGIADFNNQLCNLLDEQTYSSEQSHRNSNNISHNQTLVVLKQMQQLLGNVSKRCLLHLYQKEGEAEQNANETRKSLQLIEEETKYKYEKKISKLTNLLKEKQIKEVEVNKLLYYLRRNGVDLEEAWHRSQKEERKNRPKCHSEL